MKPVVHYTTALYAKPGQCAVLYGLLDHPNHLEGHEVSNRADWLVQTSTVLSVDGDRIETENTVYVKKGA